MKKMFQAIKIFIFMGILILPSVVWYGARLMAPSVYEEWNYDLGENREKGSEYDDNVPFRSALISLEQKLSGTLEGVYTEHLQKRLAILLYGDSDDTVMDISMLIHKEDAAPDGMSEKEAEATTEKEPENIVVEEHDYECTKEIPATCLEPGKKTYSCRDCGDSYDEDIPMTGHDAVAIYTQEADYMSYGYTEYECGNCGKRYRDDFVGKIIDNSYLAPRTVGDGVILGRFNWLFYTGNNSVSYYRGTNILSEEEMEEYLGLMERLQELCDEMGIQLQFMIVPNREQVYPEYMPSYEIVDNYKRVDRFVDYVRENSDVNIIYPLQELKEAELYWRTCYQYDTHWNHLGGYVGTQALYKAMGIPTTSPHDVEITPVESDLRGLIDMGGLDGARYPADGDYFIDYKPEVTITYTKGNRMTGAIYYADSDSENQQNFVLLGDSFRYFMIDYLVKDFSHCVIAHRDYTEGLRSSILKADVLVIFAGERQDKRMFPVVEQVITMLEEEIDAQRNAIDSRGQ